MTASFGNYFCSIRKKIRKQTKKKKKKNSQGEIEFRIQICTLLNLSAVSIFLFDISPQSPKMQINISKYQKIIDLADCI